MGKLFATLLVAAPLLAFAVWAYLHQTQTIETRIDQREVQFRTDWDRFDQRFSRLRGWEPDPEVDERIEHNKAVLESLAARKAAAQVRLDSAVETVDAELKAYDQSR